MNNTFEPKLEGETISAERQAQNYLDYAAKAKTGKLQLEELVDARNRNLINPEQFTLLYDSIIQDKITGR